MNTHTHTSRTRKLRYATLSVAIAVGAVAVGTGTGSATATSTVTATDSTVTAERGNLWAVVNFTDRTLTAGEFYRQQGDRMSTIMFGNGSKRGAQEPGDIDTEKRPEDYWSPSRIYTWGRVCYNHLWWNLRRDGGVRFVGETVYVFAFDDGSGGKKLVANPPGAGEDIPLIATSPC